MTSPAQQHAFQAPEALDWREHFTSARHLLTPVPPARTSSRVAIHRAISTAYYAIFHTLNANNASIIIGQPSTQFAAERWTQIYRRLQHDQARRRLMENHQNLSPDAQIFATAFNDLQLARIEADYIPNRFFTAEEAANLIDQAEAAIQLFLTLRHDEQGAIAAVTLFGN